MMNKFFIQNKKSKKSGESLVEVLIAVVIVMIFLTGILTMLHQSIFLNENIRMRVMAVNLAREGIEGVRHIRDTNWLAYSGNRREKWLEGLGVTDSDNNKTGIIKFNDGEFEFTENETTALYLSDGVFTHTSSTTPTPFSRKITLSLDPVSCPPSMTCPLRLSVTSQVTWTEEGNEKEITLQTYLYDYFKRSSY